MNEKTSTYDYGHVLVAALRLFAYRNQRPPSVRELSEMLELSTEMIYHLCNRLQQLCGLEVVPAAFEERLYLRDHLKLESLPKEEKASDLEAEVQKLQEDRQRQLDALEKHRTDLDTQKEGLFSDLERQLKEGLKRKKNPLDNT
jgi:hypothetical protein